MRKYLKIYKEAIRIFFSSSTAYRMEFQAYFFYGII
ncbi:hypothetical protein CLPUN_29930 [Clostridium puniceum]|uniref:Uncharacterized protein n=1 Tax=Clostridium puniceum TaxID=29367 RepID=A0A1S8TE22_9CLOT|nr:hypothetical protein CLPUN_29930 [Clostridium puniceum]